MVPNEPDRNLLLGVLGVQLGLIGRDALVDALADWAVDRARPLGALLVDRGVLAEADRALVEAAVDRHVDRHGGAAGSLSTLSLDASLRDELTRIADPEVTASLGALGADGDGPEPAPAPAIGAATAAGGRFRVVRPHAWGGLGLVYVARDEELNREVALKQIQERHAENPVHRARFLAEAEVTGGLEHPGVVPVYGLGHDERGRPFYAMRFIRGESLKEAIAAFHGPDGPRRPGPRGLALRKLLRRFLDVCNAVDYAHSRGILHRDLKPSNVMVGPYGETLVVDWGLAKVLGRPAEEAGEAALRISSGGSSETLPGSAIGTPAYMSPEQAEGDPDRLGPATDVYGLGAILHCLLTGRSPVEGPDVETVLERVRRGAIEPPRAADPAIDRSLEAICLKALALRPADRYPTARALAEDLERWLADEPVTARPDPPLVRAGRWARRHRPLVAGLAGLVLAGTVGLAVGAALLGRANRLIDARRDEAERNAARAEENYRFAREAVDRFYTTVGQETLLDQPQMEPLRRQLLESARDYYERFAERRGDDPEARADLGRALNRLSRIEAALGEVPAAARHAEEALAVCSGLVDRPPGDDDARALRSQIRIGLAERYAALNRYDEAEAACLEAVAELGRLAERHPGVADHRRWLASAHDHLGIFYKDLGRDAESEAAHLRSLAILERLVAEQPGSVADHDELATALVNLAVIRIEAGRYDEAEADLRRAIGLRERLLAERPASVEVRVNLALTEHNLAAVLLSADPGDEAAGPHLRRALALRERLVDEHPGVAEYRYHLSSTLNNLAAHENAVGRTAEAEADHRRALAIRERLVAEQPEVPRYRADLAETLYNLGNLYIDAGRVDEALPSYRRSLAELDELASRAPELVAESELPGHIPFRQALIHYGAGRYAEAEAAFIRSARRWAELAERHRENAEYRDNGRASLYNAACAASLGSATGGPAAAGSAARAIAYLRAAAAAGHFDDPVRLGELDRDSDLDPIRHLPAFRALRLDLAFPADPFAARPAPRVARDEPPG